MWLKTAPAPHDQVVEQTLPPSADIIARFKAALHSVLPRVHARALLIVRRKRWSRDGTMPEGQEVQDLVQEAIRRFMDGTRRWDPDKVTLEVFLDGVVRSLASDLVRSLANRVQGLEEITEGEKSQPLPEVLQHTHTVEMEAMQTERYQALADEVMDAACQEPMLEKIVQAVMDGCEKPEAIAQETGLPITHIYAGLRKIRRRLDAAAKRRA